MTARTPPPKKTALGVEEMRQRTHGLSQRHRTMLLLVNGKRERHEVLTLAGQAGVDAAVLDELVSLGLVDAGPAPVVAEAVVEPPPLPAASAPPAPALDRAETPPVIAEAPEPMDLAPTARVKFSAPRKPPSPPPTPRVKATVHAPSPVDEQPVLTPVKPPPRRLAVPMSAPAAPADEEAEQKLIAKVRNLLIGSVLVDSAVSNPMTALRVRKARTREELTALVWEIERRQVTARRPRDTTSRLVRARELLGLGNTIVEEDEKSEGDTQPEPPPSV